MLFTRHATLVFALAAAHTLEVAVSGILVTLLRKPKRVARCVCHTHLVVAVLFTVHLGDRKSYT
jgi:hypothetical protein